MFYIFHGEKATFGKPHSKTGLCNTIGKLIAFTTMEKRNEFFNGYCDRDVNRSMTKCSKSTCRQFFLGMSVEEMVEHLEHVVNVKADETYNNWSTK